MNENEVVAYLRTYTAPIEKKEVKQTRNQDTSIDEVLVIDTETLMTPDKSLLYGFAMLVGGGVLKQLILFCDPDALTDEEIDNIVDYATTTKLSDIATKLGLEADGRYTDIQAMGVRTFNEWLYATMWYKRLLIVGHSLAYDISRLALSNYAPTGRWAGGFGLVLKENKPAMLVKHLGYGKELWGIEKKFFKDKTGKVKASNAYDHVHFLDTLTLAGSLLGEPMSLSTLGKKLGVSLKKLDRPETDYRPTKETLEYASQDVLTTYACYQELKKIYEKHNLTTPIWNMLSGASLGKAYLKEIGVKSFSELHPDFPPEIIGYAMQAYYGGRSEINIRLKSVRGRLRDFSGEYPTACALMGIQNFLLAKEIVYTSAISEVREVLDKSVPDILEWLKIPSNWEQLTTLVKIKADGDRLPLRAVYGDDNTTNIALPFVTSDIDIWYTFSDAIASKLLTEKSPDIVDAIRLVPGDEPYETNAVKIMGTDEIDVAKEDFFIRVGDLRQKYKKLSKKGDELAKSIEQALKLMQNSTSYGSLVEINQSDETSAEHEVTYYDKDGTRRNAFVNRIETPGHFFSPLGTFIPASGRLLLAIAERLGLDRGIIHGMADTDSMFYVLPDDMSWEDFIEKEDEIGNWFQTLSPYTDTSVPLFKLELDDVWFIGISAKRYCMYRKTPEIEMVKVSSHGTGAISKPYANDANPYGFPVSTVSASRWVHDLWYKFVLEYEGAPMIANDSSMEFPTKHQISITTPHLLKTYGNIKGMKPFNFFVVLPPVHPFRKFLYSKGVFDDGAYMGTEVENEAKRVFYTSPKTAFYTWDTNLSDIRRCDTHKLVPDWFEPTTINEVLIGYFTHSEAKALNGKQKGVMTIRTVRVTGIKMVGKEVNEVIQETTEESAGLLGRYKEVEYDEIDNLSHRIKHYGVTAVSKASGIPERNLQRLCRSNNKTKPHAKTIYLLNKAFAKLENKEKK